MEEHYYVLKIGLKSLLANCTLYVCIYAIYIIHVIKIMWDQGLIPAVLLK